jgi:hypothetical protein
MDSATIARLLTIMLGVGIAVLAHFIAVGDATLHEFLFMVAGTLVGGAGVRRPGDVKLGEAMRAAVKPTKIPPTLGMLIIALSWLLVAPACHQQFNWPKVVSCSPEPTEIIGDVGQVLITGGDYLAALEALAKKYGANLVTCAVDELVTEWSAPGAARNEIRDAGAQRGRQFLASQGITVVHTGAAK